MENLGMLYEHLKEKPLISSMKTRKNRSLRFKHSKRSTQIKKKKLETKSELKHNISGTTNVFLLSDHRLRNK